MIGRTYGHQVVQWYNPSFVSQGASVGATLDHEVIVTQMVPEALEKGRGGTTTDDL